MCNEKMMCPKILVRLIDWLIDLHWQAAVLPPKYAHTRTRTNKITAVVSQAKCEEIVFFSCHRVVETIVDFLHHRLIQIDLDPASVVAFAAAAVSPSNPGGGDKTEYNEGRNAVAGGGLLHSNESAFASTPTPTPRRRRAVGNGNWNDGDTVAAADGRDPNDLLLASGTALRCGQ
jgi:hypothetical protein